MLARGTLWILKRQIIQVQGSWPFNLDNGCSFEDKASSESVSNITPEQSRKYLDAYKIINERNMHTRNFAIRWTCENLRCALDSFSDANFRLVTRCQINEGRQQRVSPQ